MEEEETPQAAAMAVGGSADVVAFLHPPPLSLQRQQQQLPTTTPLLLLLDGILSQDHDRIEEATEQIRQIILRNNSSSSNNNRSGSGMRSSSLPPRMQQQQQQQQQKLPPAATQGTATISPAMKESVSSSSSSSFVTAPRLASLRSSQFSDPLIPSNPYYGGEKEEYEDIVFGDLKDGGGRRQHQQQEQQQQQQQQHQHDGDDDDDNMNNENEEEEDGRFLVERGSSSLSSMWLHRLISQLVHAEPKIVRISSSHDGSLPLHFAASLGDVKIAHILLSQYPQACQIPNHKGKIPLMYAAREGRISMVRYFLSRAPHTASIASKKRKLALHFAAGDGHTEIVRLLLHAYPDGARLPSAKGKLPIHFAARWGHMDITYDLVRMFPDCVRALDHEGSLPLHDAAREGQVPMSRFLLEQFPAALITANLRGEIPLFPAVRSGNMELVLLLLQAWPYGGRHVLQNISNDDAVSDWSWDILELLLRGATDNWTNCTLLEGREPPSLRLSTEIRSVASMTSPNGPFDGESICTNDNTNGASDNHYQQKPVASKDENTSKKKKKKDKSCCSRVFLAATMDRYERYSTSSDDVSSTHDGCSDEAHGPCTCRSKSPILHDEDDKLCTSNRKRKGGSTKALDVEQRKHQCVGPFNAACCCASNERDYRSSRCNHHQHLPPGPRRFLPLNSALESAASCHVIRYIIERRPDDVELFDDWGRTPLHWAAMSGCRRAVYNGEDFASNCAGDILSNDAANENMVNLILQHFLTPKAAMTRDIDNRLPLHCAIRSRAHPRLLNALLDIEHPSQAAVIESCGTYDEWHDATPVTMACHYGCDLNTVYRLLRVDPSVFQPKQKA